MASNEVLCNLFEMLTERLSNIEDKSESLLRSNTLGISKLCVCQISTLEISKENFKLITKNPVINCPHCKYKMC